MLGLREFAEKANLSYNGVRRMALAGEIPCIRIGNRFKFAEDALEKAAAMQTAKRKEKAELYAERDRIFENAKKRRGNCIDFNAYRKKIMDELRERVNAK